MEWAPAHDFVSGRRNLKSFQLTSYTGHLHLTSPLSIALFGLIEEAPRAHMVTNLFVVEARKFAGESLLVNELRTSSGCDSSSIGCFGFFMIALE